MTVQTRIFGKLHSVSGGKLLNAADVAESDDAKFVTKANTRERRRNRDTLVNGFAAYRDRSPVSIFNTGFSSAYDSYAVGYDVGTDIEAGTLVECVSQDLKLPAAAKRIRAEVSVRAQVDTVPSLATDALKQAIDIPVIGSGINAGSSARRVFATLSDTAAFVAEEGTTVLVAWSVYDENDDLLVCGIGSEGASGYNQRRRGFFHTGGNWFANAAGASWTGAVYTRTLHDAGAANDRLTHAERQLADVSQTVTTAAFSRFSTAFGSFATGVPAADAWAIGLLGPALAEGTPLDLLEVRLHRPAGAETFEVLLVSRPVASTAAAPGITDRQEWTRPLVLDATPIAEGSFGDLQIKAGTKVLNDPARAYMLIVEAKDSNGELVDLGCGKSGDGADLTQLERGFYRSGTTWTGVGTSAALCLRVLATQTSIKSTAVVPAVAQSSSAPSKTRGMVLMLGRSQLACPAETTYRRAIALPPIVKRIREVLFSHATGTAIPIGKAAIAPLESTANYAATGATWTPLTFDGLQASEMPASASASQRYALHASDPCNVELLDRTDIPGAAKIVMVSAYISGATSPILLGKADNTDDYKQEWESRADFPMVMRQNAGDCVTDPADFTSTDNQLAGTPIAGLVCECEDGELATYMFVGDSITNGAGIKSDGLTHYGLGWAETLAYAANTKYRGVLPVLLGWSGCSMSNIRYQAKDLYAFCAAKGLPVPNILHTPNASPNSMSTPLTEESMAAQRPLSDEIVQLALGAGSQVVKWLCLPVDPHVKDLDPSTDPDDGDAWRRAYNQADRDLANLEAGVTIADFAAAMEDGFDADGQALFDDDLEDDGIHPNAAGYVVAKDIGTRADRLVLPAAGYAVGGLVT